MSNSPGESFPTNPIAKPRKKKVVKRAARRKPWYLVLEPAILQRVVGEPIRLILLDGVTSKADLLEKLEGAVGGSVGLEALNRWLKALGLDEIFTAKKTYRLPQHDTRGVVGGGPVKPQDVPGQMQFPFMAPAGEAPKTEDDGGDLNFEVPPQLRAEQAGRAAADEVLAQMGFGGGGGVIPGVGVVVPSAPAGGGADVTRTTIPTFK